jgi:hypothetical protein
MGKKAPVKGSKQASGNCKVYNGKTYKPVLYHSRSGKVMAAIDDAGEILHDATGKLITYKSI